MATRNEMQFEKLIDEATKKKDFQLLEQFLATEDCENASHKCSKQFVNKLDKLLCWEIDKQEVKSISVLLNYLQKCADKIVIAGEDGLPAMIKYGLIGRMVNWFEKIKEILVLRGNEKNEMITSLAEDFFSVLLAVWHSRPEGKMEILENFALRTCTLITDVRISIYVQQEVVRKLNLMLDNMPRDARKRIFSTKEMLCVMSDMGKKILDAGDYDLQVAITEALCRMISEKQRGELACQWFPMEFVSSAFKGIKDSEFETDCRKFLNQVNGMLGDKRRVFTYPCLSAALDEYELQIPMDENLEEFWIDFNIGTRSISFYVAADDADYHWETVIIPEEEVDQYSLEEKDSKKLLTIALKSPVHVGNQEGEKFFLYFDSILEIRDVTRKIYGFNKCKDFSKKQSASVAKTTVHVVFDESGSQVLVPESQLSPEKSEEEDKLSKYKTHQLPGSLRTLNKNTSQENCRGGSSKITTSCKRKVSEASVIIPGKFSTRSPLVFVSTSTPCKGRFKLPLEMMSSAERSNSAVNETVNFYQEPTGQTCAKEVLDMMQEAKFGATQKQTLDEVLDIVPDSQPVGRSNRPLLPCVLESSFDKSKTWKKRVCSVPEKNITMGGKQKLNQSLEPRVSETSFHSGFTKEESDVPFRKETANPKATNMKTKSKEMTDAAKSLISKISDRYKVKTNEKSKARDSLGFNRPRLNKSCVFKDEVQDRKLKSSIFLNTTAGPIVDDVYNFNISGFDEPTIKLGMKELHVTGVNAHRDSNKKGNADDGKTSTEVKQRKQITNNKNKKHLFNDTDTETRGDDCKTDISWLQESNRKPKARLNDYSRNKQLGKPINTDKTEKLPEPVCHVDKPKGKNADKEKTSRCKKQNSRTDEPIKQMTRQKWPRRAALAKNYKEPSSSESESERESLACISRAQKSKIQKRMNGENRDDNQQKELQDISPMEPKRVANCVPKAFTESKKFAEEKKIEMPSFESPMSLEIVRCTETGDVTQEHTDSERSLGLQESTPEKAEMLNFEKGISPSDFHPQKKNCQSLCLNQSPEMPAKKLTFGNKSFSPALSEASLHSLPTYKTVNGKHAKGSACKTRDNNEDSSFRHCFLDTCSIKGKLRDTTKPTTKSKEEDCVAPTPSSASSGSKVQSWSEEPYAPVHDSGPTIQPFLKRRYHSDPESNSDEAETSKKKEKKGKRRTKLQPREILKTESAATYRVSESISPVSANDLSGLDGEIWEPGCSTISICQKLQKEFTKKIESRSRKMDNFTKQSLRAAHEHLSAMSYQLCECRSRQLEEFRSALLEQLENFENDSQCLKNMEKEFSTFWKKHAHTFSTYVKNEQQRIQILKSSFEKNVCHTGDCEERVFISEMHLMKEELKGLQEKLLKEMQEEELCNVRRGLQTLFQSEDRILQ
ncbi:synaptonemal complex protein 2 [Neopsephotus bourkii]|uniref:synaptonemal complex protein 2 n=1 Tax=Neopsephotus bourkii TaxID=309878 RepID=UPI002AA55CC9|nr:synaptonemal complex protein 2 [Neopsephotus bourkii]